MKCEYCEKNHYDNGLKKCLINQNYDDKSMLNVYIIEGTLHAHLNLFPILNNKKCDYSSCIKLNYCPMCGKKLK